MEVDPLEMRKYDFGSKKGIDNYLQWAAQETPEALESQYGLLRGSAGGLGLPSAMGEDALGQKIGQMRSQRLGEIEESSKRNMPFEASKRMSQTQSALAQKQAFDYEEERRRAAERAARGAKRAALTSGLLGIGGAVGGGIVGGPAGAMVGAGLGSAVGSFV